jgi:uncharacterized membrane protein YgdD (TMEM256/DUF423 family)
MIKKFISAGAILGATGVALGAFGAHGLQQISSDEKLVRGFQTAVHYHILHAVALLVTGLIYERFPDRLVKWAGYCFIAGIFLFSGSLYLLTLLKIRESGGVRFVGPITPLGGLFFIAGWLSLAVGALWKK